MGENQPAWQPEEMTFRLPESFYYVVAVLGITFLSFLPSLRNEFMPTWDDEKYVTANPVIKELSSGNIAKMFTKPVNGSYVPLPLLTFAIEYKLSGEKPLPFHATNLLLHLFCVFLVFRLLRLFGLDLIYAAFGALIFGVHPMHVESVAWITERKDVLYGAFYLGAVIMYLRYVSGSEQKTKYLLYSLLLFLGSLLSKIEAVALPLTLLLADYLMKRPFRWKVITEKIPFFLLSLVCGVVGILIIYRGSLHGSEILKAQHDLAFADRFLFGLYALTGYLFKFLWPFSLSAMYPYPEMSGFTLIWVRYLNPLTVLIILWLVFRTTRRTRIMAFGMLFFLVNVIFLLQIAAAGKAFFADRYVYLSYLGLILPVVWVSGEIVKKVPGRKFMVFGLLSLYTGMCMVLTFSRCRVWQDGITLWSDVIGRYGERSMEPYVNRGASYFMKQDWNNAEADFTTALTIGAPSAPVYADRGMIYGITDRPGQAVDDFTKAIALEPGNVKALFNRGVAFGNLGNVAGAAGDFREVIRRDPKNVNAYAGLSLMLIRENRFDTCILLAGQGLTIDPYRSDLYDILGNCEFEEGLTDKAIEHFRHSLRIDNDDLDACLGLAAAYAGKNDPDEARKYLGFAREMAGQKNLSLGTFAEIEKSGIFLPDKKKEVLLKLAESR